MPTRPVSWDLDIPPASLLAPEKKPAPTEEMPSLDKLRDSLTGYRFELLKISVFAAFLLAIVGIVIHGSHIASPDNQFATDTVAAMASLGRTISSQASSMRAKSDHLVLA